MCKPTNTPAPQLAHAAPPLPSTRGCRGGGAGTNAARVWVAATVLPFDPDGQRARVSAAGRWHPPHRHCVRPLRSVGGTARYIGTKRLKPRKFPIRELGFGKAQEDTTHTHAHSHAHTRAHVQGNNGPAEERGEAARPDDGPGGERAGEAGCGRTDTAPACFQKEENVADGKGTEFFVSFQKKYWC